jgi:hypothetical protein
MPGMDEFLPRLRELQVANETSEWPLRLFHATAILLRRSRFLRYDHTQQDLSLLLWARSGHLLHFTRMSASIL